MRRSLGELEAKLEKRTAERDEALAREAGAAEVLQIINASAGNFAPVLEVILEKALALCAASLGDLSTYDGERFLAVATRGFPPTLVNFYRDPFTPGPRSYFGR